MVDAVEAVCEVAPDEFPGYEMRQGRLDQTLVLRKARNRGPAELRAAG